MPSLSRTMVLHADSDGHLTNSQLRPLSASRMPPSPSAHVARWANYARQPTWPAARWLLLLVCAGRRRLRRERRDLRVAIRTCNDVCTCIVCMCICMQHARARR